MSSNHAIVHKRPVIPTAGHGHYKISTGAALALNWRYRALVMGIKTAIYGSFGSERIN